VAHRQWCCRPGMPALPSRHRWRCRAARPARRARRRPSITRPTEVTPRRSSARSYALRRPRASSTAGGRRRVEARRQRARHGLFVGFDHLGVVDEHRAGGRLQQCERAGEHVVLELRVVGSAERAAERELTVQRARRRHLLGHLPHRRQHDGGDTGSFEHVGEHTHGARAQRSNGREDHHVDAVGAAPRRLPARSRGGWWTRRRAGCRRRTRDGGATAPMTPAAASSSRRSIG
jgi:hypothetical protein